MYIDQTMLSNVEKIKAAIPLQLCAAAGLTIRGFTGFDPRSGRVHAARVTGPDGENCNAWLCISQEGPITVSWGESWDNRTLRQFSFELTEDGQFSFSDYQEPAPDVPSDAPAKL